MQNRLNKHARRFRVLYNIKRIPVIYIPANKQRKYQPRSINKMNKLVNPLLVPVKYFAIYLDAIAGMIKSLHLHLLLWSIWGSIWRSPEKSTCKHPRCIAKLYLRSKNNLESKLWICVLSYSKLHHIQAHFNLQNMLPHQTINQRALLTPA